MGVVLRPARGGRLGAAIVVTVLSRRSMISAMRRFRARAASRMVQMTAVEYGGMARLAMTHIALGDNSPRVAESLEQHGVARVRERFAGLSPERYPTIVALAERMTFGDGVERFAPGLDVIANGLLQTPIEGRLTRRAWEHES
jgi:hypothetical protein